MNSISVVAIVSKNQFAVWEKCHRGSSLPGISSRLVRVVFVEGGAGAAWTVEITKQSGRFDGAPGDLILLRTTTEEPTDTVEVAEIDCGKHFEKTVRIGRWTGGPYRVISGPVDPARHLWWAWSRWYSNMVPAWMVREELDHFVSECETLFRTVTDRNRLASRVLYRLARNNGWRMLGSRFAHDMGLPAGRWITDQEFNRRGRECYGETWRGGGIGQYTLESARAGGPDAGA